MTAASSRDAAEVMVSGSRSWTDAAAIRREFLAWESATGNQRNARLHHGGARGADQLAAREAYSLGWAITEHPADWDAHGRKAGILRNLEMLDLGPDHVFIFWDGESRGTKHVLGEVQRRRVSYSVARRPTETPREGQS